MEGGGSGGGKEWRRVRVEGRSDGRGRQEGGRGGGVMEGG